MAEGHEWRSNKLFWTRVFFCTGRKTVWNWQGTSPSSTASKRTAANTSWSLTKPPKRTAATTRWRLTAESPWLSSWFRVSLGHDLHGGPFVQYELFHSLQATAWRLCHSWHAVYSWDTVTLVVNTVILSRTLHWCPCPQQLKLGDLKATFQLKDTDLPERLTDFPQSFFQSIFS